MLQKCTIIGLVFLLAGGLAMAWLNNEKQAEQAQTPASGTKYSLDPEEYLAKYGRWYNLSPEQQNQLVLELDKDRRDKAPEQLALEQQARLRADLDKLAARQMEPGDIADFLYGKGWENQVEEYKKLNEKMEITQIISVVCLSIGGILFALCVLVWVLRLFVRLLRRRRQWSCGEDEESPAQAELMDIHTHDLPQDPPAPEEQPRQGRRRLALTETVTGPSGGGSMPEGPTTGEEFLSPLAAARARTSLSSAVAEAPAEDNAVAVLLADEPAAEKEWSADMQWSLQGGLAVVAEEAPQPAVNTRVSLPVPEEKERAVVVEDTLKEQADGLQRQIAEFKEMAQSVVQQATREQSEPLGSTLKELAQQVSAIREYAACQQDRVEKLQDGYDWGIIRTFCLRVIRCIDNIENRIDNPPKDCPDLMYLEEVRDELLFALESSGIEQFRLDINSEYRGQEKLAEAIKDKAPAQEPGQAGKVAEVLRPGYRYMMDDENYKVVRTAQVKLFG